MSSKAAVRDHVFSMWRSRSSGSSWDWVQKNVFAPNGARFDGDNHPWGKGVCDAFDDPNVREIDLMWGSRLGKTFIAHSLLMCQWDVNPMPTMFGSATQTLAVTSVREKLYPMLEKCPVLYDQLKPASRRSMQRIDLRNCQTRVAWSGSETALADFGAFLVHGNEISKWSSDTSREADPLELFLERTKEFPDHKVILESTPALKGRCRIDQRMANSTYRSFWVPCPKCGKYQILVFGDKHRERGIIWDKSDDGHSDKDLAYRTARYLCEHCQYEIHDDQRAGMMRAGVWAPAGCHVDPKGNIKGEPLVRSNRIEGFQLASWYSLQLRWGDMAAKWVGSHKRPRERQNFINSWGGIAFENVSVIVTADQLADRLSTDIPQGVLPSSTAFITIGVDRQIDHWVFMVVGWGVGETGHLIDYGVTASEQDLLDSVIRRVYESADGVRKMRASLVLYDSGDATETVYTFCKRHSSFAQPILPCKGQEHCGGKSFKKVILGETGRAKSTMRRAALSAQGQLLVHVSKDYWQPVIQQYLEKGQPGKPASLSFCAEAAGDLDLCEQLLNGGRFDMKDKKGRDKRLWVKKNIDDPDDFRDALEYARAAAEAWLRGRWSRVALMLKQSGAGPVPDIYPVPPPARQPARESQRKQSRKFVRARTSPRRKLRRQ